MPDVVVVAAVAIAGMALVLLLSLAAAAVMVHVHGLETRVEVQHLRRSLMDAWAGWQAANTRTEIEADAHRRRLGRREVHIHRLMTALSDMARGLPVHVPPMPVDSTFAPMARED